MSTEDNLARPADQSADTRDFEACLERLEASRAFGKAVHLARAIAAARRVLKDGQAIPLLHRLAPRFEAAGLFAGSDWDRPELLQPGLVRASLLAGGDTAVVECLSALRLLSVARGEIDPHPLGADRARRFLEDVLARNLDLLFPVATEATREADPPEPVVQHLLSYLLEQLDPVAVIAALSQECDRVLLQRPIQVERVETMLAAVSRLLPGSSGDDPSHRYAAMLLESLTGPTSLSRAQDDAGYREALAGLTGEELGAEAVALGRRMDETGLVCPRHATLLRYLVDENPALLPAALALNAVGSTSLEAHEETVRELVQRAVTPATARCIYGLSRLLNRGILFFPPVAPGLQRLMVTPIAAPVAEALGASRQAGSSADPRAMLLAGTLSVIGQPRGMDQGHNPTCQAARAISLWSHNDVGYLLELITAAVRDNDVVMHFEGEAIHSNGLPSGLAGELHTELDAVSLVLTPHLDRLYMEMSRRTIGRGQDGHRWVNPELHGWWVFRDFAALVDIETSGIRDIDAFVRRFCAAYHPRYNGGRELVYAQPCGVVSTDANARFVGWHAVSIERVARDPQGEWRVYFFNPNRDKGQNWGQGIETSTCGHGEWEGESSLPVEQFLMRLYVFHYKSSELGDAAAVPADLVERVRAAVASSWGADRPWQDVPVGQT